MSSYRCQEMASPSRSGSVARYRDVAFFSALEMASTCFWLRSTTWYFIAKSCSGSTAPSLGFRSRTCPYEASTSKSLPRYFLIVFALAGDSTMTRLSAITYANSRRSVRRVGMNIGYQIFQSLERLLLPGLARQHHEHYPFQLLCVQLVGIERQY